jgi:hypothetical protein
MAENEKERSVEKQDKSHLLSHAEFIAILQLVHVEMNADH